MCVHDVRVQCSQVCTVSTKLQPPSYRQWMNIHHTGESSYRWMNIHTGLTTGEWITIVQVIKSSYRITGEWIVIVQANEWISFLSVHPMSLYLWLRLINGWCLFVSYSYNGNKHTAESCLISLLHLQHLNDKMTATVTMATAAATTTTTIRTSNTHALVGSSKLKYLSDGAEVASLVVSQTLDDTHVNYVKRIRSNNGWVDVAVIDQVTYYLHAHIQTQTQDIQTERNCGHLHTITLQ